MTLENTSKDRIEGIVKAQKEYFQTGETLDVKFRKEMLKKLLCAIERWEDRLSAALWKDLHKSYEETCEIVKKDNFIVSYDGYQIHI